MEIKKITAEESYIVRHPVLRYGRPIQDCAFEYDDHPSSIHLGLEVEGKVISVISALPIRCENFPKLVAMRLRGIATLESYQRQGYGTQLINGICLSDNFRMGSKHTTYICPYFKTSRLEYVS